MKLTDICEFHGGSQPPKSEWSSEYKDGYIRMLQIRDFTQEGRVTPEYVKISNRLRLCTEDDILIGRYGASVGKILSGKSGAYNVAIMKAVPDTSVVRKQYLRYYFLSPNFQNYILNLGGRAAQAGFSKDDLARLEITVVSLEEQDKIVNELSTLEKTISTKQKQLKEFDDLVKSRFIEMFGHPDANEKGWEKSKLENFINVVGGYAFKSQKYLSKGIPVLRIGNINAGYFRDTNLVFYQEDSALEKYKIYPNDLVISLTGTAGKDDYGNICLMDSTYGVYYLNQRNAKIEIKHNFNRFFLMYLFAHPEIKQRLTGKNHGIRQGNILNKDILELDVYVPPIELQNEFADFVKLIDKSKFVGYFTLNIFYVKSSHFHHPP